MASVPASSNGGIFNSKKAWPICLSVPGEEGTAFVSEIESVGAVPVSTSE